MSFQTYANSVGSRLGEDGNGLHSLYYRNYAHAVGKSDPLKRSRIVSSQNVGAWVPARQQKLLYSDKFYATTELLKTKCMYTERLPCTYSPLRNHYSDSLLSAEEFTRPTASMDSKFINNVMRNF